MFKKIFLLLLIIVVPSVWYLVDLPDTAQLKNINPSTTAIRTYREKQALVKGEKPHSQMHWRKLSQISSDLQHAVILSEDDTFFQHHGFDIEQLKRAVQINWERKKFAFGASTLTQQLARTLYLTPRKNIFRKAKEALITRSIEKNLTKNRILELYLNVVEWGPQIYGAEAAAQHFFGKSAADLSTDEAVALAVILPSPRKWNPLSEHKFIANRKSILRDRMVRAGYISVPDPTLPDATLDAQNPASEPPTDQLRDTDDDATSDDADSLDSPNSVDQ